MRYRITVEGVVQGVGFRPFVKRLADRFGLAGLTFNTAGGLVIELEAKDLDEAQRFLERLEAETPAAARIERRAIEELPGAAEYLGFQIVASSPRDQSFTLVSTDLATCLDCLNEIQTPGDRRFGYAFTNCTNCGPRYSIVRSTPYDRGNTTMSRFVMCAGCAREYADAGDRRFHAEPIACPACGPRLSAELPEIRTALEAGTIVALKGLGGYQLACDAFQRDTVDLLRIRKRRSRKPFAVMMRDLDTVQRYCHASAAEQQSLLSPAAPIVLLRMRNPELLAPGIAPGLREVGVMLPYTPLHHLLFSDSLRCVVMTSGNISEEPIAIHDQEAEEKLAGIADHFLTHDREIFMRVDDSVQRHFEGRPRMLRRARGFAPEAIAVAGEMPEILACGGELKNTFCLTKGRYAILSQHIGDLENFETLQFFEETLLNLQGVYQATPRLIAHDLHPDYLSTRWAMKRPEPKIAVQHHHAHVASCMAENGLDEPVIGVAFDGTGLGSDGQVWGGEFLVCNFETFERWAHLRYVPLPGGDRAAREPWRMAGAYLFDALGVDALGDRCCDLDLPCWQAAKPATWKVLNQMMKKPGVLTSSCGRLFDAVASICGVSQESSYEGESAMKLEAAAASWRGDEMYRCDVRTEGFPWQIDLRSTMAAMAHDVAAGKPAPRIARCFHNSIAHMIEVVCKAVRERNGLDKVCLSGGTFQNFTLLTLAVDLLRRSGFQVFLHSRVPPNDGGIALGQAVIAAHSFEKRRSATDSRSAPTSVEVPLLPGGAESRPALAFRKDGIDVSCHTR